MSKVILGTWSFSQKAVEHTIDALLSGNSTVEAIEKGINYIEENEKYGKCIVGIGGPRNAQGHLELDAAVMNGTNLDFGAVVSLKGFSRPFSVARAVMDHCPHNMLSAEGAAIFAEQQGFVPDKSLSLCLKTEKTPPSLHHDTLGIIVLKENDICCGVTTSGMPNKHPGRIGDSALPGNGLYADRDGGAACCSGDGDLILKFCPAFQVVQYLKQGMTPREACATVINWITNRSSKKFEISIIAVNMKGEYGSGTTVSKWTDPLTGVIYNGFPFVVWKEGWTEPKCICQEAT